MPVGEEVLHNKEINLKNIESIEKRLWEAADDLRANSK